MKAAQKKEGFPETVESGIPRLPGKPPVGWSRSPLSNHLYEEARPVKLVDDQYFNLVTVKRARGGVVKRETKLGRDISVKTQFRIHTGDFLISKRQIVHGACGIVPTELSGSTVSNEYAVLCGHDSIDMDFLKHLSHSVYFQQTCFHSSIGVHIEKMLFKLDKWLSWPFDLPPIGEQKRIAEILSTWDRAIETTEKLIENSRAHKKLLMQQLITGKSRFPEFKEKWKMTLIGSVCELQTGGTPSTQHAEYWNGDIPWMSSGEINLRHVWSVREYITQLGMDSSNTKIVPPRSVLIALAGQGKTRGKVAINHIPLCTNQSVAAILPSEKLLASYLFHNLDSRYSELRSLSSGDGGRGGLNLAILRGISIPLPCPEEQKRISAALDDADSRIATFEKDALLLRTEKTSLMQQLLTGKRRVKIKEKAA